MNTIKFRFLTDKEKKELFILKTTKKYIVDNFTLASEELEYIKKIKKSSLKIGYALQYLLLKNFGYQLHKNIPLEILKYVGEQIEILDLRIDPYLNNEARRLRHFSEIVALLNFSRFKMDSNLEVFTENIAKQSSNSLELTSLFLTELKNMKIVVPGISTIEDILSKAWLIANKKIYKEVLQQFKDKKRLDILLDNNLGLESVFSQFKNVSVNISSNGAKELLSKIKFIDEIDCNCDLGFLSESKISYFLIEIQKSDKFRIQRFADENKKYAYLAMFLYFRRKHFVDMVIEVTSNYAYKVLKRSRKKKQKQNALNFQNYRNNSNKLKDILKDIIKIDKFDEFKKYKDSLLPLKEELDSQEDEAEDIDFLLKFNRSFNYTNELLECINFDTNTKPEFVKLLNSFPTYKKKKRLEINILFFSSQWQKYIKKYDYSKKVIEIALLYTIRDNIRSGDLFVKKSEKYNSFDHYLIEPVEINDNNDSIKFINEIKSYFNLPKKLEFNLEIDKDERSYFSDKIYNYFPKITMTEMIYEVNSWTSFLDNFKENSPEDTSGKQNSIVATLLSNGHNIGFSKMSVSGSIDEGILRRTNEYYFNHSTLSKAQISLVNYHHSLNIVKNWGDGGKSSSDGMRIPINSKTIYADYNTHYGNKGGAIYRHISDQYTPYYVQMLQGRDSNHVLDGLLYHGTNLNIYEHSTDTAGYTEQMFALTYLLGFKFKPRIKNAKHQQLYYFENISIGDTTFKKINEKVIVENYHEILRLVESIRSGKVKASLIMQKIGSYARDNTIAKALKELGRILKTMYLLEFFTDKVLRKEVQQMLNKGESINSVGRILHFGKNGRINESTIEDQLEKASSLNILLGVLVAWNSRYLEKVYKAVRTEEWFDEEQFKRVSPLGSSHINFLGKYVFEEEKIVSEDGLRPLKIKS